MSVPEFGATTSDVGVPVAERALTDTLDVLARSVVAPGSGRSLVHLHEVEVGSTRPDAILLVVSLAGLNARLRAGLRLPSLAHARVLESIRTGVPSGYSRSHVDQLTSSLRERRWLTRQKHVRDVSRLIARSLVVEAKVSDWRRGIRQLAKARWLCHEAALLMPLKTQHRVSRVTLRHNRLGLLVARPYELKWQIRSPSLEVPWAANLWLTELAIRDLETCQV